MAAGMLKETREAWPALGFHERFEQIICMVMAVLIALEFKHSIPGVLERKRHVIQVQAVVLIALLALVRRFIILEATKTGPMTLIGLAPPPWRWAESIGSSASRTTGRPASRWRRNSRGRPAEAFPPGRAPQALEGRAASVRSARPAAPARGAEWFDGRAGRRASARKPAAARWRASCRAHASCEAG